MPPRRTNADAGQQMQYGFVSNEPASQTPGSKYSMAP